MSSVREFAQYQLPVATQGAAGDTGAGTAGAAATLTYAAVPTQAHWVSSVTWSYSATPSGGGLTIQDGGATIFQVDITAAGPDQVIFDPPLMGTIDSAMVITLAAPGGSLVGKLNARHGVQTP